MAFILNASMGASMCESMSVLVWWEEGGKSLGRQNWVLFEKYLYSRSSHLLKHVPPSERYEAVKSAIPHLTLRQGVQSLATDRATNE